MKGRVWERLAKEHILPDLPGFAVKGRLVFRAPVGLLLQGVVLNGSIDPNGGYVEDFVQPLFVPADHITISNGNRLRRNGQQYWPVLPDDPVSGVLAVRDVILAEAVPFLDRVGTLSGFARYIEQIRSRPKPWIPPERRCLGPTPLFTPGWVFDIAACHILLRNRDAAEQELAKLSLNPPGSLDYPSTQAQLARCDLLARLLAGGGTEAARAQLMEWRSFTLAQTRLERWAEPNPVEQPIDIPEEPSIEAPNAADPSSPRSHWLRLRQRFGRSE